MPFPCWTVFNEIVDEVGLASMGFWYPIIEFPFFSLKPGGSLPPGSLFPVDLSYVCIPRKQFHSDLLAGMDKTEDGDIAVTYAICLVGASVS